jgi:hypothetical protein
MSNGFAAFAEDGAGGAAGVPVEFLGVAGSVGRGELAARPGVSFGTAGATFSFGVSSALCTEGRVITSCCGATGGTTGGVEVATVVCAGASTCDALWL